MSDLSRWARRLVELVEARSVKVAVKELPDSIRKALRDVGYRSRDIGVVPQETVSLNPYAGDGERGFAILVNLSTGASKTVHGDWGGSSPVVGPSIDRDHGMHPLPRDGVAIVGSAGGRGTYATIYVHPDSVVPLLPGDVEMSEREAGILRSMGMTSSYRKELFADMKIQQDEIDALVKRGWISMNKAGALSLTTAGKNAAQSAYARR
jgi:hypothetical protein